jgi:hypothetical protein
MTDEKFRLEILTLTKLIVSIEAIKLDAYFFQDYKNLFKDIFKCPNHSPESFSPGSG